MKTKIKVIRKLIVSTLAAIAVVVGFSAQAFASAYLTVSPPRQKISLIPGKTTYGTFSISSPNRSTENATYKISISPFTIDDSDNSAVFETNGDYNKIVNWITLDWYEGTLEPNETKEVRFAINTPKDAPAGGQYAAIMVSNVNDDEQEDAVNIKNYYQIAHLIYADVAGETVRGGEITNTFVPGFLFSGNITASATIVNNGNVHAYAKHTLKISPLFSDEEFYTNEEEPEETLVMPEGKRYTSIGWNETPSIGIFRVNYKVEFEGVENQVSKLVIVCPLWLLFVIVVIIALIVVKFVLGKKKRD